VRLSGASAAVRADEDGDAATRAQHRADAPQPADANVPVPTGDVSVDRTIENLLSAGQRG